MSVCAVCDAAEFASEDSLRQLVRYQAVKLAQARDRLDTFALAAANARVRELEETIARLNRTRPQAAAVEVCLELARCDPRDQGTLRCQWCGEQASDRPEKHRADCAWRQAFVVASIQGKRESGAVVDRWTNGRSA